MSRGPPNLDRLITPNRSLDLYRDQISRVYLIEQSAGFANFTFMEPKINNISTPTQCDDLSNTHSDAKTAILNALWDKHRRLVNKLVVTVIVCGLVQTVVIIAGLVIINAALHP